MDTCNGLMDGCGDALIGDQRHDDDVRISPRCIAEQLLERLRTVPYAAPKFKFDDEFSAVAELDEDVRFSATVECLCCSFA